jgi:hypothetical protein
VTAVFRVAGERLSDLLLDPPDGLTEIEVVSPPPNWVPLKPLLLRFVRTYRERGLAPPVFAGVPLCLFGSEWPGFPSRARTTPARGRCAPCLARRSCGFGTEVPDELLPLSEAPPLERWREYGAAFQRATGSDAATGCTPFLERIMAAYRGAVSLEPSVLLSDAVEPSARFVVFPHRMAGGTGAAAEYHEVLACVRGLLADIGAPCGDLVRALAALPPMPMPVGMEGRAESWRLKLYLRVEDKTPAEKQAVLDALARGGAGMDPIAPYGVQMLGLVLDAGGLHTIKAYVAARPSEREVDGLPPSLAPDHPLVMLTGDRALATLDVWCRGAPRANKWDFNLREHYMAGVPAERVVEQLAPERSASQLRPLLVGLRYRADVVAIGLRATTVALYMELN